MERKMIRVKTVEGTIAWLNKNMIVSVAKDVDYEEKNVSIVQLLNRTSVSIPGTPDDVMLYVIGT